MKLIQRIYPKYKTVSIVGTSKNAGKTVTMNTIITQADEINITLGLISTGRDGERRDVLTNTEKPAVFIKTGTIVAVLERSVKSDFANLEILRVTDYSTALGRIVIARAISDGYVEISGPVSVAGIKDITEIIFAYGVNLLLIDGSLDRRASAAPFLADATILSTGAALSRDMDIVVQKTKYIVDTYSIERLTNTDIIPLVEEVMEQARIALIDESNNIEYIDIETAINCGEKISHHIDESTRYLILTGSVTVNTMHAVLNNKNRDYEIIVKDSTKVFLPKREMKMFTSMGMKLKVLEGITIAAITINPYSPEGYYFDSDIFIDKMKNAIDTIPILDVMQEG